MLDSVIYDYVNEPPKEVPDIEAKRESLAYLATLGTTKDWIGENFSLGDVKRLSDKNVEKYFLRYQAVLGKRATGNLTDAIIDVGAQAAAYVLPIDDVDEAAKDLKKNDLVTRELSGFAGYLALNAGRLVAIAIRFFRLAKHISLGKPNERSTETEEPVEPIVSAIEQGTKHV